MEVYLLRHAAALPLGEAIKSDADRPLTAQGKLKMRRAARGLKAMGVRWDRICTSPLLRARQTAQVVAEVYAWPATRIEEQEALQPGGNPREIMALLAGQNRNARVLLVGHEPDLSRLASTLLSGSPTHVGVSLKKGGLARIDVTEMPPKGRGLLRYLLVPKFMRAFV